MCPEIEACDDGFRDSCGSCNADCTGPGNGATCGDGERCVELEVCDDGFIDACGSCNADCTGPGLGATCGDGERCPELEACDDGNTDSCSGACRSDCRGPAGCGDGIVCGSEACDLGNSNGTQGCSFTCSVQAGYQCNAQENSCWRRIFVDGSRPEEGDGNRWNTAFKYLQDGLTQGRAELTPVEIWVAKGTYTPDRGTGYVTGDFFATYVLPLRVALVGGFAGTESTRAERDLVANETVLSGDLLGNDVAGDARTMGDNSCQLLTTYSDALQDWWSEDVELDGVTVAHGNAVNCAATRVVSLGTSDTLELRHSRFRNNVAADEAVWLSSKQVLIEGTVVADNISGSSAAMGVWWSSVEVRNCEFTNNTSLASHVGGGGLALRGNGLVMGSDFVGNRAESNGSGGGGMLVSGEFVLANNRFVSNYAEGGGAFYCDGHSAIVNNIIAGNSAAVVPAGYAACGPIQNSTVVGNYQLSNSPGPPTIFVNSILYGNDPQQFWSFTLASSCIDADWSTPNGTVIANCDPQFVDALGADGILGTIDDDYSLLANSPAIDAGDSRALPIEDWNPMDNIDAAEVLSFDFLGNPRLVDRPEVDTGAGQSRFLDVGALEMPSP